MPGLECVAAAAPCRRRNRWAAEIVSTRAVSPPPDVALRDLSGYTDEDPTLLAASLTDGASLLAAALREAVPKAQMWCPVDGGGAATNPRPLSSQRRSPI